MGEVYEPRSGCPINATIEVFGDRWSLLVLRDIVFADRRYFRELQANSIEGIASNILADRLTRLVESGLLTREDTRAGKRALYSLTEPAIQLIPVFAQLGSWGLRHRPTGSALRVRAELLEQGPRALAGVHGRTAPLAPWRRYPTAITERSRASERGLPRCYQLLVAARPSTMSKGADGRRPSCLTCERSTDTVTGGIADLPLATST
jgi:DNA-binding HxlR family transcriptional regulator